MKKNHNFQFGGNKNTPSDTQILPFEVSNSNVFTKYKLATLFMVFALFFYFIDFGRAEATTDCDGCTNGTWIPCDDNEKILVNYAGCNAIVSFEKKVCTTPAPTKYELRITGFELSPGCTSPDIENLMKEANKKLLWSSRAIFGVTGSSINVRLITRSCWEHFVDNSGEPDINSLRPCVYIEDCCQTLYALSTVEDDKGLKINNSTQTNASDSLCVGTNSINCGSYICESQNLPSNVPLWDVDNTICGTECDNPWNADASDFVEITISSGCKYRAYYALRNCDGETYFTLHQLSFDNACSPTPSMTTLLDAIRPVLFAKFGSYITTLPDTAYISVPKCWTQAGNIYYPCSLDDCCIYPIEFSEPNSPQKLAKILTIVSSSNLICSNTSCVLDICGWFANKSATYSKIGLNDETENSSFINISPIPITDEFNLNINSTYSETLTLEIYSMMGEKLIDYNFKVNNGKNVIQINSKSLVKDQIYFYKIINIDNEVLSNGKLIK